MKSLKFLTLALTLGMLIPAQAKLLHIIHTNDLHSMFQGTRDGLGGYARLKTLVNELKRQSLEKNIRTLYLDGGDFGEGSSFYFSNNGVDSLRALDLLGVDVTVIGNHDFILGGPELKRQMKAAKLKARVLSGNITGKRFLGLKKLVPESLDYDLDGLKVRIMGLTTSEVHYQYPLRPLAWVSGAQKTGIALAEKAEREGVDFLVALTHIGIEKDIDLVKATRTIDLIVGGHSHTFIPRPQMVKNMEGREVPILQVGAHSLHVGSLLIDVQPEGKSTIIDYKTYDITQDIPEETGMKQFVERAVVKRAEYFGRSWNEVIGFTEIPFTGYVKGEQTGQRSCWSHHLARLTRQAAKTDIGIQFDDFQGEHIDPGPVTFGDMVDNFPHFRKWHDRGWRIKRAWVQGYVLKKVLKAAAKFQMATFITLDGLEVKVGQGKNVPFELIKHPQEEVLFEGHPINNLKYYSISMPSEVPHAFVKVFNIFGYLIFNNLRTVRGTDYWPLLETYIRKNSPIRCLSPQN